MTIHKTTVPEDVDSWEQKLIGLAYTEAERKLAAGNATDTLVTYFLKLGTARARLELEKTRLETLLLEEKIASASAGLKIEAIYEEVLTALKTYSGRDNESEILQRDGQTF